MSKTGYVTALFCATKEGRETRERLDVDPKGIVGDKFYGRDSARAILLTSHKSYKVASSAGIALEEGRLSENICVDINLYRLPIGSRFRIGNISFEIAQAGTLCKSLKKVDPKLPKVVADCRGVYVRALEKGSIAVGDRVSIFAD